MEFQKEPGRIYAERDGKLVAEITFPAEGGTAVITHTFVDDSLRGQGVAAQLVHAAAEQIRAEGKQARPVCSYAQKWFAQHPEASDLL